MVTILPQDFPPLLQSISDPPERLFVLGDPRILYGPKIIAIVGTRQISTKGVKNTSRLTKDLVKNGFIIISGMALGVDGAAHQAAINSGGNTIAVLGTGVDIVYPPEHRALYNSILEHGGVIVSEVPPGKYVARNMFAARNRIVSGLSQAVVVVEGALKSGSLITARLALDQGRDVFAVPGSPGTDYLISMGATPLALDSPITISEA